MKIGRYIVIVLVCLLSAGMQAVNPSGTLPIVYMTTNSGLAITDKENYVPGTVYIDCCVGNKHLSAHGATERTRKLDVVRLR